VDFPKLRLTFIIPHPEPAVSCLSSSQRHPKADVRAALGSNRSTAGTRQQLHPAHELLAAKDFALCCCVFKQ